MDTKPAQYSQKNWATISIEGSSLSKSIGPSIGYAPTNWLSLHGGIGLDPESPTNLSTAARLLAPINFPLQPFLQVAGMVRFKEDVVGSILGGAGVSLRFPLKSLDVFGGPAFSAAVNAGPEFSSKGTALAMEVRLSIGWTLGGRDTEGRHWTDRY